VPSGVARSFCLMNRCRTPAVLLLDTNIVVLSWRYRVGDEGFDLLGELRRLARTGQERLALDLLSLEELFALARMSGTPRFIVAAATVDEVQQSRDLDAAEIGQWATELATYNGLSEDWPFEGISVRAADLLAPEITGADAHLFAEVARLQADALLTFDYRLIRRRERGKRLQLQPLTPFEVEDWMLGCRQPPWNHRGACRPRLARVALLTEDRRGLRLGDADGRAEEPVRAAQ
jgi:predicted nucleic acid-binding protein